MKTFTLISIGRPVQRFQASAMHVTQPADHQYAMESLSGMPASYEMFLPHKLYRRFMVFVKPRSRAHYQPPVRCSGFLGAGSVQFHGFSWRATLGGFGSRPDTNR